MTAEEKTKELRGEYYELKAGDRWPQRYPIICWPLAPEIANLVVERLKIGNTD